MAETYPYPEAEHYEFPRTPVAVLRDELQTYKGGYELRKAIIGLGKMYADSPLHSNLLAYAALMKQAATRANLLTYSNETVQDTNFLAGELLATHCSLRPMPRALRRHVLQQDMLGVVYAMPDDAEVRAARRAQTVQELIDYRMDGWHALLQKQETPYRETIIEAAASSYNDMADTEICKDNFQAGYLYAGNLIFSSINMDGVHSGDDY